MKYWWVNQGKTYTQEVGQDFMWSPITNVLGHRENSYDNMTRLEPGDLVFSHHKSFIRALGIVQGRSYHGPQPDFGNTGNANWADTGWHCDVLFTELETPLNYSAHIENIRPLLPEKYSPLDKKDQAVVSYLFEISLELGEYLLELTELEASEVLSRQAQALLGNKETMEDAVEKEIVQKENIGPLEKENLVKARRGQGTFKTNVKMYERQCRVTGLKDRSHLIASHIKPWGKSDDKEKIDGQNGLLLSPHIDWLFNYGFISFSDDGVILISSKLNKETLDLWSIDMSKNVGGFLPGQASYLKYHRENIFKT